MCVFACARERRARARACRNANVRVRAWACGCGRVGASEYASVSIGRVSAGVGVRALYPRRGVRLDVQIVRLRQVSVRVSLWDDARASVGVRCHCGCGHAHPVFETRRQARRPDSPV